MDMTWITDRIAVGGAIWDERRMLEVVEAGITHILDMQIEFDDTLLAEPYFVDVLWNPVDDDFQPKPAEIFQRGVDFSLKALEEPPRRTWYILTAADGSRLLPTILSRVVRMRVPRVADSVGAEIGEDLLGRPGAAAVRGALEQEIDVAGVGP